MPRRDECKLAMTPDNLDAVVVPFFEILCLKHAGGNAWNLAWPPSKVTLRVLVDESFIVHYFDFWAGTGCCSSNARYIAREKLKKCLNALKEQDAFGLGFFSRALSAQMASMAHFKILTGVTAETYCVKLLSIQSPLGSEKQNDPSFKMNRHHIFPTRFCFTTAAFSKATAVQAKVVLKGDGIWKCS